MRDLWRGTFVVAAVVGCTVIGLILWSVLRYRRRHDDLPDQRQYNVPIEVVYTLVPVAIVAVLFAFSFAIQRRVDQVEPNPDVVVRVDGFQWNWQFTYVREGITITGIDRKPELVLPVGQRIRFDLVSHDVAHSFFVPGWLFKRDVIPGVDNVFEVDTTKTGTYLGRCAEFCGLDHSKMLFDVSVVPVAEYDAWLAAHSPSTTTVGGGS